MASVWSTQEAELYAVVGLFFCKVACKCREVWEKEGGMKDWTRPQVGDDTKASCRFCKCEIRAHHADLIQHAGTEKHKKTAPSLSMRLTEIGFTSSKPNETRQANELKIATYVACHTSISAVDHLSELIGPTSTDKEIKIHRTKYTALINHAIALCKSFKVFMFIVNLLLFMPNTYVLFFFIKVKKIKLFKVFMRTVFTVIY